MTKSNGERRLVKEDSSDLELDEADAIWDALGEKLEAFIEAWEATNAPPELASFALGEPPLARQLSLIELIKVDLEYRWKSDQQRALEDYGRDFPELAEPDGLPADLIYEEFHVRRQAGDEVRSDEYLARFPGQESALRRLLSLESPETSSAFQGKPKLELAPGDTIDDFDLLNTLGEGSFASVFLARQRSMARLVALKVSFDEGREPQTLAQLDHPNIVRVFDQRPADGHLRLMYMQYVPGCTLHDVIQQMRGEKEAAGTEVVAAIDEGLRRLGEEISSSPLRQRLQSATREEAVAIIGQQIADALAYAHGKSVLHRDLKPANVLLNREGVIKLVDFNISFCSKLEGATAGANFGGSLGYMSPEQLDAMNPESPIEPDSVTETSDIYAMGVLLFELLVGYRPFRDRISDNGVLTLNAMAARRRAGIHPQAQSDLLEAGPVVGQVIVRCLEPDSAQRPQSATDAERSLRLCQHERVRRLFEPGVWRRCVKRFGGLILVAALVLPNALAGIFNYFYNEAQIIRGLQDSQGPFFWVQLAINGIAFPLGALWGLLLALPVIRAARAVESNSGPPAAELLDRGRKRALRLGNYFALVSLLEWLIAGFLYPFALQASGVELSSSDYLHFISSLAICGAIAMAYPFIAGSSLVLFNLYAPLLTGSFDDNDEVRRLESLNRGIWIYLAVAAMVPTSAIVLLISLSDVPSRLALIGLCGSGLVGFAVFAWLARAMQRTAVALQAFLATE